MLAAHWPRGRWIVAALALVASRAWLKDELSLCHRLYWSYSRATRCGEHGVCGVGARTPTRDPHARTAHAPIRARAAEHTSIVHQTRVPFPFPRSPVGGTPSTGLESAFLRVERNSRCLKNSLNGRGRGPCKNASTVWRGWYAVLPFSSMEETRVLRTNNERDFD